MSAADDFQLSFYEEVSKISERNNDIGSEVWLVKDTRDDRLYVKKHLKMSEQRVYEAIMEYEKRNKQKNKLVGVPQIFTMVSKDDTLVVVEEYINHPTLRKVVESEALTVEELIMIFREICVVMKQLHTLHPPIIHRDIKPDNIMVDMNAVRGKSNDTKVYVIDWNAAREYSFTKDKDTRLMGTFDYAAPEQLGYGQSDVRTDIYGVGATLEYCMNEMDKKSISENGSHKWNQLKRIVEKAKALSPDDRYASDDNMMIAFNELLGVKQGGALKEKLDFTPPGFRTKKLWKMIVAIIGYIFIVAIVRETEVSASSYATILYEKACYLMLMLCHPLWFCNYLGVQDKFKWAREGNIIQKIVVNAIAVVAIWGFWAMLAVLPDLIGIF